MNNIYRNELAKKELIPKQEFDELFRRFKYENDTKAFEKLIESNLRLVVHFVYKYSKITDGIITIDDLINEGNIGLIKALQNYDETKNIKFGYYASYWIKKMILEVIKKNQKQNIYIFDLFKNEDDEFEIEDVVEDTENEDEMKRKLKLVMKLLNEQQSTVIKRYFGFDCKALTQEEIGAELGITKQRVGHIIDKSITKLKNVLKNEN